MVPIAFVSSFAGEPLRANRFRDARNISPQSRDRTVVGRRYRVRMANAPEPQGGGVLRRQTKSRRVIGIVSKSSTAAKETTVGVDANASRGGIFGMKAQAYWESIGVLPLSFAGFGIVALAIKMLKVKGGELRSGPSGVNKVTIPKTAITTEEEEAELHVFKCGGCGYEMYPARGREFKFFPDSFKCPLCGTPKSEFWDLNDPDDPRNQEDDEEEEEEEEEEDVIDKDGGNGGPALVNPDEPSQGSDGAGSTTMDRAETDPAV